VNTYNVRMATGISLIVVAVLMVLNNIAGEITDLKDWHGAVQPSFIGPAIKHATDVLLGALGGAVLPTGGVKS
jgi:hypothetical protein